MYKEGDIVEVIKKIRYDSDEVMVGDRFIVTGIGNDGSVWVKLAGKHYNFDNDQVKPVIPYTEPAPECYVEQPPEAVNENTTKSDCVVIEKVENGFCVDVDGRFLVFNVMNDMFNFLKEYYGINNEFQKVSIVGPTEE